MINILFVGSDGREYPVSAATGTSLMRAAIDNAVPGIIGDCGGQGTCATCHAYVVESYLAKLPAASQDELDMLDGAIDPQNNSRLTCQLAIAPEMEGMRVTVPASQI